jgi:cytochrome P450
MHDAVFYAIVVTSAIIVRIAWHFAAMRRMYAHKGPIPSKGKIPVLPCLPLLGNVLDLNPHCLAETNARFSAKVGLVYVTHFGTMRTVIIADPHTVKSMYTTALSTFDRNQGRMIDVFGKMAGGLVLQANGPAWRADRSVISGHFHRAVLDRVRERVIETRVPSLLDALGRAADHGQEVEMEGLVQKLALDVIGEFALGVNFRLQEDERSPFGRALHRMLSWLVVRYTTPFPWWKYVTFSRDRRLDQDFELFYSVIRGRAHELVAAQARGESEADSDIILSSLLKQSGGEVDEHLLRQCMTIIFAGNDTTVSLITWALYYIFRNPEIETTLVRELADRGVDSPMLDAVCKETLRLRPPALGVERETTKEYEMVWKGTDGVECRHTLPPNSRIGVALYVLHTHEQNWVDPLSFRPDRWLNDADGATAASVDAGAYLPFGAGPRRCVGEKLAVMEAKITLAAVVKDFRLLPVHDSVGMVQETTLKMAAPGYVVRVERRNK